MTAIQEDADRARAGDNDLSAADLEGEYLNEVDLSGLIPSSAGVTGAKYDDTTTWPDDFDLVERGGLKVA